MSNGQPAPGDPEELYIPSLPYRPGCDTSREAARRAMPLVRSRVVRIFRYVFSQGAFGTTSEAAAHALDLPPHSTYSNMTILHKRRWVRDSGIRRNTQYGRAARVWIARPVEDRILCPPEDRCTPSRYYMLANHDGYMVPVGPWSSATARDDQLHNYPQYVILYRLDIDQNGEMLILPGLPPQQGQ